MWLVLAAEGASGVACMVLSLQRRCMHAQAHGTAAEGWQASQGYSIHTFSAWPMHTRAL